MKKSLLVTGLLIILALILFSLIGCEPVRVIETITTDSTGKTIKTKTKYYQQTDGYSVHPDVHIITTTPLFYNRVPIYIPTYRAPIVRGYGSYGFRHRH
jgi:hypothetical protein